MVDQQPTKEITFTFKRHLEITVNPSSTITRRTWSVTCSECSQTFPDHTFIDEAAKEAVSHVEEEHLII